MPMNRALIQCEGAPIPSSWANEYAGATTLEVNQTGPVPRVSLRWHELSDPIPSTLEGRAHDLVNIAAHVYVADQLVSRGSLIDLYGDDWCRDLGISIP